MHADRQAGLPGHSQNRVPVIGVYRWEPHDGGVLGEGHGLGPLLDHPGQFGDGQGDVVQREDHGAEQPVGGGGAPLVEQVVVVRAQAGVPEFFVRDVQIEAMPGEARVVGEAELPPHTVDIHVGHAGHRVVAAGPDLVEAGRAGGRREPLHRQSVQRAARAHRDVDQLVFEEPGLAAVPGIHDARAALLVALRHPVHPQVCGLDHVVVRGVQLGGGWKHPEN